MRRRDLLIRLGVLAGAGTGVWWARDNVVWRKPRPAFPDGGVGDWMPFRTRTPLPVVEATAQGRPIRALIDSGAQYSVVDRSLVDALGLQPDLPLPMVAYGVGGGPQLGRAVSLDVALGGVDLPGLRAAVLSLGPLAGPDGLGTPLILGQDLLSRLVLEIEPEARRARLRSAEAYAPPPALLPVAVRKGLSGLTAQVTVEGAAVEAVVDTGASAVLALSRSAAEQAGLFDGRPSQTGSSFVLGGVISARVLPVDRVEFGGVSYHDLDVAVFANPGLPVFPAALLGMEAFAERNLALDLGRNRLWAARPMDVRVEQEG